MKKNLIALGLAGTLAFSSISVLAAPIKVEKNNEITVVENENTNYIKNNKVKNEKGIEINIPTLQNLGDDNFEKKINEDIQKLIEKRIEEFKTKSKDRKEESELKIGYEIKSSDSVLSFIIETYEMLAGDANGETIKYFYNIDLNKNELLNLEDFFLNSDYERDINNIIEEEIAENKDLYFENEFNGIDRNQNFYVNKDGDVVIAFDQYEIGPRSTGFPEFTIKAKKATVTEKELTTESKEIKTDIKSIHAVTPVIKGLTDGKFQAKINKTIEDKIQKDIKTFIEENKDDLVKAELKVSYEIKSNDDVLSIIVNTYNLQNGGANANVTKDFYNIDLRKNEVIELEDLFLDENFEEKINKSIREDIALNKDSYFDRTEGIDGFKGIKKNQNFYIDANDDLYIVFDMYEIAPRSTGFPEFKITTDKVLVDSKTITSNELNMDVSVPVLKGLRDSNFEKSINEKIKNQIDKTINDFKTEKKDELGDAELTVTYDVRSTRDTISIVVNTYGISKSDANGVSSKYFYNIDLKENKEIKIDELIKLEELNTILKKRIEEEDYSLEDFKGVDENQGFYLDLNGNLIVVFDMYEIGPRSSGFPEFIIELNK